MMDGSLLDQAQKAQPDHTLILADLSRNPLKTIQSAI
jgi:hypothetical protein